MELVIRKADLLRELQLLQGIVERKTTIPILSNILLEAGPQTVQLLATDLDVGLRSRCEASVGKPGTMTLPARKLFEIVKALPETDVRIEEDKAGVKVAADRFESRMSTLPPDEFPNLPTGNVEGPSETLPAAGLRQMVAKTQFAITGEDTRYFLNGGLLVLKDDGMSLVETRRRRPKAPRTRVGRKQVRKRSGSSSRRRRSRSLGDCWRRRSRKCTSFAARTTCSSSRVDAC
jgi:DNA polymerase-3 subunit beta